jgi:hypothetical protein
MTWHFHSGPGSRAATLLAVVSAALLASVSLAPVAGAGVGPLARTWAVQPSPNPTGAVASGLSAVSCPAPGSCVAVGGGSYPSGGQIPNEAVLVEQLVNGTWTIARTPKIGGAAASSGLNDVSCPVAAYCVAVGYAQFTASPNSTHPLAETWNGTSWSHQILPAPAGGSDPSLAAVSCAAPGACAAVGNYYDNKTGAYRPLAEQLAGSTWSVLATPNPPHGGGAGSGGSEFDGVACTTTTLCEVVGDVTYNDTLQAVFAYSLSGTTWTFQRQANPGQDPGNTNAAVSCSATSACTSVGWAAVIGEAALAEHWNGSKWVLQTTPGPRNRPATALYDVSCYSGSSCVAVGQSYRVDQHNGQLVDPKVMGEVWNGKAWTQSPPTATVNGATVGFSGIACPSRTACIAVGDASTSSTASTLIEAYTS